MLTVPTKSGHTCYHNVTINGKRKTLVTHGPYRISAMVEMYFLIAEMQMNNHEFNAAIAGIGK